MPKSFDIDLVKKTHKVELLKTTFFSKNDYKLKCKEILAKLPKSFDIDLVKKTHKVEYTESMNTVLHQELIRFNKLLNTIRSSVIDLGKAIDGFLTMSSDLEKVFISIFDNK